ncbi:MAG TPA: hypothetical protein GX513_10590 [Firmicutes bacterium]|nr:hypothetical protein [Bacillota bacterium]
MRGQHGGNAVRDLAGDFVVRLVMPEQVIPVVESQIVARSRNGVPVRLPAERWEHIRLSHPELDARKDAVVSCIAMPEKVFAGNAGELLAVRQIGGREYVVVVYREVSGEDGFVVTAFVTTRPERLERRKLVWPRQQK